MKPSDFAESTTVFRAPAGMTEEECGSLAVHDTGEAPISRWEPTPEERQAIAAGAPIWLWVFGRGHPPVSLATESPFAVAATGSSPT
jgi:hypothetical protein